MKKIKYVLLLLIIFIAFGCQKKPVEQKNSTDKLKIAVSIAPIAYLVDEICGELAEVSVILPEGQDVERYEMTENDIATIKKSDVFFRVGVPFERSVVKKLKMSQQDRNIVDVSSFIAKRVMKNHFRVWNLHFKNRKERHSTSVVEKVIEEREKVEGMIDTHVWLSSDNLKTFAKYICENVCSLDKKNSEIYKKNLEILDLKLDALYKYAKHQLSPYSEETILAYHPAFGYLTEMFGINQEMLEVYGEEPYDEEIDNVVEFIKDKKIKAIFTQPEYNTAIVTKIAEKTSCEVVVLNVLDYDVEKMIKNIADNIASQLE